MKTAISMPDEVFDQVNDYAERHKLSRSEVFVVAVKDLLDKEERDSVAARIKSVLEATNYPTGDDLEASDHAVAMSRRVLSESLEDW